MSGDEGRGAVHPIGDAKLLGYRDVHMGFGEASKNLEELPVSADQCLALVERIAGSQEFRRASRLREFLLYVCNQTLEHGATEIHEQEIGEAVFRRPGSYDTNVDNIVRVNATGLRKRLDQYFADDGAQEEILLEIPRGSYRPVFRRRVFPANEPSVALQRTEDELDLVAQTAEVIEPQLNAEEVLDEPPARRSMRFTSISWSRVWPVVSLLLLLACIGLLWRNGLLERQLQPWKHQPALRAFWSDFFDSDRSTDVVLADTSFALAEDMMQRKVSLSDYLNYNYKRFAESTSLSSDQRTDLALVLDRKNGSMGDFGVAQQILALDAGVRRANLQFARDFTIDAAKHDHLVLIGSQESNPWVSLFAGKLNFALERDPLLRKAFVSNRAPQSGEQARYPLENMVDPPGTGYGVIAYLPDLSGKGKTLIIEGTDSQATGAAGEFVTSEDSMESFQKKLPSGRIPSFEILLRTSQLSGTPLHAEVIAYRVYSR